MSKKLKSQLFTVIVTVAALFSVGVLLFLVFWLARDGISVISWEFITSMPRRRMTEGGIWPAIVGTVYVSGLTMLFALPLGIFTAIYLSEYASQGWIMRIIQISIRNLAGVPSIVYGLFGLGLFVSTLKFGHTLLSASLTLALMALPLIVSSSEEALKTIPLSFREGALALGATKWQMVRYQVLPYAIPGIITGSVLSLGRIAGETAPIILTGAAYFYPLVPQSVREQFMALPYHLYILATQHEQILTVRPLAYGTALVLVALVLSMSMIAILIRSSIRRKRAW